MIAIIKEPMAAKIDATALQKRKGVQLRGSKTGG